jgi:hypothetical protein
LRYYVYSIEGGYPPYNPLFENNDISTCISKCDEFNKKYDVNCYVVDRTPTTMFEEVYMRKASNFSKTYEETREQIKKLKEG